MYRSHRPRMSWTHHSHGFLRGFRRRWGAAAARSGSAPRTRMVQVMFVDCPHCGALAEKPCVTSSGRICSKVHVARRGDDAAELARLERNARSMLTLAMQRAATPTPPYAGRQPLEGDHLDAVLDAYDEFRAG